MELYVWLLLALLTTQLLVLWLIYVVLCAATRTSSMLNELGNVLVDLAVAKDTYPKPVEQATTSTPIPSHKPRRTI